MTRSTPSFRRGWALGSLLLLLSGSMAQAENPPGPVMPGPFLPVLGQQCAPNLDDNGSSFDVAEKSPLDKDAEANPQTGTCDMSGIQIKPGTLRFIFFRHGEKTRVEQGQLCCTGQNRALLLPDVLIPRYGHPDQLYAPDPHDQISSGTSRYSYVRPLATIEPTAISRGMTVNTQIGYTDICTLQQTLFNEANATSTIFVAWEHIHINAFAAQMINTFKISANVPEWKNPDYDRIYVFTITTPDDGSRSTVSNSTLKFQVERQGLDKKLSPYCATAPQWLPEGK